MGGGHPGLASPPLLGSRGSGMLCCCCAAAKSIKSCPTLCDPIDSSPPGSAVLGILQTRTLAWVAISFSIWNALAFLFPTPQMSLPLPVPNYGLSNVGLWDCPQLFIWQLRGPCFRSSAKAEGQVFWGMTWRKCLGFVRGALWTSLQPSKGLKGEKWLEASRELSLPSL